jgi:hypothetical protein
MRSSRHLYFGIALALSPLHTAFAAPAPAATAAPAAPPSAAAVHAAEEKLASQDPAAVQQAIDALAQLGGEGAANAIAARLRRGLPPQLIEPGIAALEHIGKPSAAPVLLELALPRRPQVRAHALAALGALKVKLAQAALLYALDDPSAEVREAAVAALAQIGDARALPPLFAAAERGMPQALIAIGNIATPRDVKTIVQRAKDGDVTRIKPALQTMLERTDFPVQGKLAIVRELAALGSAGARNHLVQWLDAWKTQGDPRLRQALFDAIKRLDQVQPAGKPAPAVTASAGAHKPATAANRTEVAQVEGAKVRP